MRLFGKVRGSQPAAEWRTLVAAHASATNEWFRRIYIRGDKTEPEFPQLPQCYHLFPHLLAAIRDANRTGQLEQLRNEWPPAHVPLIPHLEKQAQTIPTLCFLDDGSIVARIGET